MATNIDFIVKNGLQIGSGIVNTPAATNLSLQAASNTYLQITTASNVIQGSGLALATNATNGFMYVASGAGTPTGVPATLPTGSNPLYIDTTNGVLYFYSSGWKTAASGGSSSVATNLANGAAGEVPYQSAPSTTSFTTVGTPGQVLTSQGSSAPVWQVPFQTSWYSQFGGV